MSQPGYLPPYFHNPDYAQQEYYQELFNRTIASWFNVSLGFQQPIFTNAEVAIIVGLASPPPLGTHWYNSDLDKMQFLGASGVQTITSV